MAERSHLDELAAELEGFSERLADVAMDVLRAGLAEGTEAASERATRQERLVNRARAAVEKAVNLLGEATRAGEVRAGGAGRGEADPDDGGDEDRREPVRRRRSGGGEPAPWDTA